MPVTARDATRSALILVAINVAVVEVTLWQRMSLVSLMLVYAMQSLFVGAGYIARVFMLQPHERDPFEFRWQKWDAIKGFIFLFGIFHLVYAMVLAGVIFQEHVDLGRGAMYGWCALAYGVNEAVSLVRHVRADAATPPEIDDIDMPLLRIFALNFMMIFGLGFLGTGFHPLSILIFGVLKTVADVLQTILPFVVSRNPPKRAD